MFVKMFNCFIICCSELKNDQGLKKNKNKGTVDIKLKSDSSTKL